jgi:hypothetical protein
MFFFATSLILSRILLCVDTAVLLVCVDISLYYLTYNQCLSIICLLVMYEFHRIYLYWYFLDLIIFTVLGVDFTLR